MRSRFPHTSWDTFDCGTAHAGAPAAIEEKVVSLQSVGTQILPKPSRTEPGCMADAYRGHCGQP